MRVGVGVSGWVCVCVCGVGELSKRTYCEVSFHPTLGMRFDLLDLCPAGDLLNSLLWCHLAIWFGQM